MIEKLTGETVRGCQKSRYGYPEIPYCIEGFGVGTYEILPELSFFIIPLPSPPFSYVRSDFTEPIHTRWSRMLHWFHDGTCGLQPLSNKSKAQEKQNEHKILCCRFSRIWRLVLQISNVVAPLESIVYSTVLVLRENCKFLVTLTDTKQSD
jgi:hypothetical protein